MPTPLSQNSIVRLFFLISFISLLIVASYFVIDPKDRKNELLDSNLENKAYSILNSFEHFYKTKGRLPWSDDLVSRSPAPGIKWTLANSPEIGLCKDRTCLELGELNDLIATISGVIEVDEEPLYVGKGPKVDDPIHVCFVPQSSARKSKTGNLYRVDLLSERATERTLESCPDRVAWRENDVCYVCVSDSIR